MRVSRQKAAENRECIIDAAGALFREKGFDGIGVADIMKAANLTHGGFYGHFASKDDLVAQASQRAMALAAMNWTKVTAGAPKNPYAALLEHYLSPRHRDDPGHGCAFAAVGGEAARYGKPVRAEFARGLESLIEIIAKAVPGRSKSGRRRKAVAAVAEMVGALMLARAVDDPALSNEILDAAKLELLAAANR
ncbi:MAG: TetR/AcrR family transcriptional regulator, transcriptional repressor for nem operon [Bradyrhizobium sp.]|nr:TetR/AcrR family transcriptional regulator, transcriptional repressor for nem operon [Bradyrhizobium sp.]